MTCRTVSSQCDTGVTHLLKHVNTIALKALDAGGRVLAERAVAANHATLCCDVDLEMGVAIRLGGL